MTARRDLKKRVRDRQTRTGERYTTARERVLAGRPGTGVPVVELQDLTADGARIGFRCTISIFPELAKRVDPTAVLERIRAALLATEGDPSLEPLRAAMLEGEPPETPPGRRVYELLEEAQRFIRRAMAGIGGVSASGRMLALQVAGPRGPEMVLCMAWVSPIPGLARRTASVILSTPDNHMLALPLEIPRGRP